MIRPQPSNASLLFGEVPVIAFETNSRGDIADLLPEEREVVRSAGAIRIGHFAAGRACAHAAMNELGGPPGALLPGENRRPVWPEGIDGSITHTDGLCIAVVARTTELHGMSIGLDTEHRGRVKPELFRRLFTLDEIVRLDQLSTDDQALQAAIGFSAKEALYKAQFPITESWVSFTDVEVVFDEGLARAKAFPATDLAALQQLHWPIEVGVDIRAGHVVTSAIALANKSGYTSES